ncbi:MAG TPA: hypothetical protein VFB62_20470, partial [Polyangiaceae bacterium]|nr:hypothetical protein [Polyangiaceae bacterium]
MSAPFTPFVAKIGFQLYPAQRVACEVAFDGVQPSTYEGHERELADRMLGPVEHVPDVARSVIVACIGGGSGKSWLFGALRLVHLGLTHGLEQAAAGQIVYGGICAPDKHTGRQTLNYVRGVLRGLGLTLAADSSDEIVVERHDSKLIGFVVLAATRGGSAVRGKRYFGFFMDEASLFFASDGYTVTDGQIFGAAQARVLHGGQLIVSSTPW